jgi:hypothetical protein
MASLSFHHLRVLRPTCNCRQIYSSRPSPLLAGVLHSRFFSDKVSRKPELTEDLSKLKLPPIDKWQQRRYFAIMEGQQSRFFLRNPDTARMLAEAFVPEGSKDLIIVEAAAGMHNFFLFVRSW